MVLPGRFLGFGTNFRPAALTLCINGILARVLLLHQLALAVRLGHLLAYFVSGKGQFGACIRCYKFSLLSKSRASSSKHSNSSNQFLKAHDCLLIFVNKNLFFFQRSKAIAERTDT